VVKPLAIVLSVLVLALPLAACGSSTTAGRISGGGASRVISVAFCAVTAYSLYRDVRAHRLGWAAFQAVLAHHNCKNAFRRP
jgi:hypothetical protein